MRVADRIPVETLEQLLPQTQCRQCGYHGCTPYAEALRQGADLNLCVPGGDPVARELATVLARPFVPVANAPAHSPWRGTVARIIEADCIGCTKCIAACPVDAIVGAQKLMHTVITDDCTGCELCLPPCPTDCIVMEPVAIDTDRGRADRARQRHDARETRLARSLSGAVTAFVPPPPVPTAPPSVSGGPSVDALKHLETAALSAKKRWKDAASALRIAEKAKRPDLDSLRDKVSQLERRANDADAQWQAARASGTGPA